ncbi:MAG: oligosaccharide flippase family protein [Bacteroidetes bacterium]|nr:oligosaccharide flippase family protein [Bacteroidota bacterium]
MIPHSLKESFKNKAKSALFRNIITTISGTTIAQAIQVLAAPLLTYFYSTELFGVFTLYFSIASTIIVIATLRYELAIMLPDSDEDALQLINVSVCLTVMLSVISFLFFYLSSAYWATWLEVPELALYIPYVALSVLSSGIFQAMIVYITRQKNFRLVSVLRVLQALSFAITPVLFYYLGYESSGLVYGYIGSQVMSALIIILVTYQILIRAFKLWNIGAMRMLMVRYKGFPGFNSLHAFSDMLQNSIINFLINAFYGQTALGLYSMAYRVLRAPLGIIGTAISQVLYQKMSENFNAGQGNAVIFDKSVRYTSIFSVPLFLIIDIIAPASFAWILGEEWREAGWYVIFLSPLFLVTFVVSPLSHLPNISGYQGRFLMMITTINALSLILFSAFSSINHSIYYALLVYSLTWMFGYIILLKWFHQLSHKSKLIS